MAKRDRDEQIAMMQAAAEKERRIRKKQPAAQSKDKGNFMRLIFTMFPLLVVPVALYFFLAMLTGNAASPDALGSAVSAGISPLQATLDKTFLELPMISGVKWRLTHGDAIVLLSIVFLFLEILKSTSTGTSTIMNHAISMGLFILCLVLFLLNAKFATSTFFILMAMTLLDVLAGVVVTIVSARRDFGMENEH